jgi:hypothetical protein
MAEETGYDIFPLWMPLLAVILSLASYGVGAYILAGFGLIFAVLYLLYCLWIELTIMRKSCVHCYYYGKTCGLGKGKLCSLFFKKGEPAKFTERQISWADLLPDFLVSVIPLAGGIILLVTDFSWLLVALVVLLVLLGFGGNALIRGSFACKYCKQREIGCPAEQLFSKEKKQNACPNLRNNRF